VILRTLIVILGTLIVIVGTLVVILRTPGVIPGSLVVMKSRDITTPVAD